MKEWEEKGYYTMPDGSRSDEIGKNKVAASTAKPKYTVPDNLKPKAKEVKK